MKKFNLVLSVAASVITFGAVADASATGIPTPTITYIFESSTANHNFDGSTITINNDLITSFDLFDLGIPIELSTTLANGHVNTGDTTITAYNASGWTGSFEIDSSLLDPRNSALPLVQFTAGGLGNSFLQDAMNTQGTQAAVV